VRGSVACSIPTLFSNCRVTQEPKKLGWEQKAISKVAQVALARVVEAERVTARIETTLKQILKGEIEAIAIQFQQFLIRDNLRVPAFDLQIGRVIVNPQQARRGKILMLQPASGTLKVTFNERSLSEIVLAKVQQELENEARRSSQAKANQIAVETIQCSLVGANIILIQVQWKSTSESSQQASLQFTSIISGDAPTIELTSQVFENTIPPGLLNAIHKSLIHLLNLRDFVNRGTQFRVQGIAIVDQQLVLSADAEIFEFPSK